MKIQCGNIISVDRLERASNELGQFTHSSPHQRPYRKPTPDHCTPKPTGQLLARRRLTVPRFRRWRSWHGIMYNTIHSYCCASMFKSMMDSRKFGDVTESLAASSLR